MESLIEDLEPGVIPPTMQRGHETVRLLADLTDTIDFFVHLCTAMYLTDFPFAKQMPLSAGEELRIRRALLRFQLYAQLFHQPEATDEIISDRDWEQRHLQQQYFWTRFTSVEFEECKCIYRLLVDALSFLRPIQIRPSRSPPRGAYHCFIPSSQARISVF